MFKNKLKRILDSGESAFGTFVSINNPDVVELIALAGFDFVIIDCEHGPMNAETSTNLIRAAELYDMTPIIRVRGNEETVVLKHLDVGAHGIQIPQINSGDDAAKAISYAKYYPVGLRGVAMPRSSGFGMFPLMDYFQQENEETLIIVHCENIMSLNNLESIAQLPEIDVIFFGPFDMSQSMGIPGQITHPKIENAAHRVLDICAKYNKIPGIFSVTAEAAMARKAQGFRYLPIGVDCTIIGNAFKDIVSMTNQNSGV